MKEAKELLEEQNNFLLIGRKGSGKTCLGWTFARNIADVGKRDVYVYNHPRPELLKKLPFKVTNITRFEQLYTLTDGVILIDEAHTVFSVVEKKVNEQLRNILSLSRQNNTDFIFICHNGYFVNRGLFSFIDVRIFKELNDGHWALERPYMSKLYSEKANVFKKEEFYIDSDYIKGIQTFKMPEWFDNSLSMSYRAVKKRGFFSGLGNAQKVRQNAPSKKSAKKDKK